MVFAVTLRLSNSELAELSKILGCTEDKLAKQLTNYGTAALEEHISMFLGQKVFTRGSDILEFRLFLLIIHAFKGQIPDEQDICKLFQTTASGSRSLIRAVMSKYQYQLRSAIECTVKNLLDSAKFEQEDGSMTISIHNLNLVEVLNRELTDIDTSLPPVTKKRGCVATYSLQASSYGQLCTRYGVTSKLQTDE